MHIIYEIMYAFDSAHGRPVEFNIWVDPNQMRRIQLIQTSNLPCVESNGLIRCMEDSTFELGLRTYYSPILGLLHSGK